MKLFIQSNAYQMLAARISSLSFVEGAGFSRDDIIIMDSDKLLREYNGRYYYRNGVKTLFSIKDSQSFTLTRFLVPELMEYKGRALVIDPDVFYVSSPLDLRNYELGEQAIHCRTKIDPVGKVSCSSSVMFLDCSRLKHWNRDNLIEKLFNLEIDYYELMWLHFESSKEIKTIDATWNDIDNLTPETKLIHFSERRTQPWMKGVDFDEFIQRRTSSQLTKRLLYQLKDYVGVARSKLSPRRYVENPSPNQERWFFSLCQELLVKYPDLKNDIDKYLAAKRLRKDFYECLER